MCVGVVVAYVMCVGGGGMCDVCVCVCDVTKMVAWRPGGRWMTAISGRSCAEVAHLQLMGRALRIQGTLWSQRCRSPC